MKKLLSVLLLLCMLVSLLPAAAMATSAEPTETSAVEGEAVASTATPPVDGSSDPNNAASDESADSSASDEPADSAASGELADNSASDATENYISVQALEGDSASDKIDFAVTTNGFGTIKLYVNDAPCEGSEAKIDTTDTVKITVTPAEGYGKVAYSCNGMTVTESGNTYTLSGFDEGIPKTFFHIQFLPADSITITFHDKDEGGAFEYEQFHTPGAPVYLYDLSGADGILSGYAVGSKDGSVLPAGTYQTFTKDTHLYAIYETGIKLTYKYVDRDCVEQVRPGQEVYLWDISHVSDNGFVAAWSTQENGGGRRYETGVPYTFDQDTTLYPIYSQDVVSVTYHYGENSTDTEQLPRGYGIQARTLRSFDNTLGVLKYWAVGSTTGTATYPENQIITVNEDLDLYAVMADESEIVTLTYHSGDVRNHTDTQNVAKNSDVFLPLDEFQTPVGQLFVGWSLERGGAVLGETAKFDKDTTLYAVWGKELLLSYDANGGKGSFQFTIAAGSKAIEFTAEDGLFIRDGYTLAGWSTTADGSAPYDFTKSLEANTTLYAIWRTDNVVIRDETSGVSVSMTATEEADGLALVANKLPETQERSAAALVVKNVQGDVEKTYILDIYFVNKETGKKESVDGSRTVTVPIPEGWNAENTAVYYVDPDAGTVVDMRGTVSADGKSISFVTTHFSFYALVQTAAAPAPAPSAAPASNAAAKHSPKTGDEALPMLWLALMGVSALAVGVLLAKKKHFEK